MRSFRQIAAVLFPAILICSVCRADGGRFEFTTVFEWVSKPTLTIRRAAQDDHVVLSIRFERCPARRLAGMLESIRQEDGPRVSLVQVYGSDLPSEDASIAITLAPSHRRDTGDTLRRLHKTFNFREITIDASLATFSAQETLELLVPAKERVDRLKLMLKELDAAVKAALPEDANESGWVIEIEGYHYFSEDDR